MTPTEADIAPATRIAREVMADAQIHKSGMARIGAEALTAWLEHRLGKEFATALTQAHAAGLAQGRAEGREEAAKIADERTKALEAATKDLMVYIADIHNAHRHALTDAIEKAVTEFNQRCSATTGLGKIALDNARAAIRSMKP